MEMSFKIKCPKCKKKFKLTKKQMLSQYPDTTHFNEIKVVDYNDHVKIECPNCGYSGTDGK